MRQQKLGFLDGAENTMAEKYEHQKGLIKMENKTAIFIQKETTQISGIHHEETGLEN